MVFFKKQSPLQSSRQHEDQDRLTRGELPLSTEARLTALRNKPGLFTSNLSVNEFVLCSDVGIRPLGQIMGSTVYQMGWQSPPYQSAELTYVTQAYLQARRLVFSRIQQEAKMIGADGVVGIRLEQTEMHPENGILEWKAFGTAIACQEMRKSDIPWLSALSGQELWALRRAGYQPVGLVSGVCGYYQKGDCRLHDATLDFSYRIPNPAYPQRNAYNKRMNCEDTGLTAGIYQARAKSMQRLESEAMQAGSQGVIGIDWEMKVKQWETEDLYETFRQDVYISIGVLGTAIATLGINTLAIDYALPLSD